MTLESSRIADATRAVRHVFLHDMILLARIGVSVGEREAPQRVRLNIDLAVEDDGARSWSRAKVGRDNLARVVDYEPIAVAARRIVAEGPIALVETLAERIAEVSLTDARVIAARVRVEKLDVYPDIAAAGVEIERRRS